MLIDCVIFHKTKEYKGILLLGGKQRALQQNNPVNYGTCQPKTHILNEIL